MTSVRSLYVHLRKRFPDRLVHILHGSPLVMGLARRLQPADPQICDMQAPLGGYRMLIPNPWVYLMAWGQHEPACCAIIQQYCQPGMRVLDIGSHVGYFTLLLRKQVGVTGEVICFEPLAENR
jgi:hypothetical protein